MEESPYGFKPDLVPPAPFHPPPPHLSYPHHPPQPGNLYPVPPAPYSSGTYAHSPTPSNKTLAFRWVDSSMSYGSVPPGAIQGGMDADGHQIFIGRAYHDGDLIPAKVIPGKNAAYVAHNGEEHLVEQYQILCRQDFNWVPSHAGHIPPGAIQGGHTADGEPLYIGRAYHEGSQTVGKIHPSHGVCYIPFGGEEIACPDYEVLIIR